MKFQNKEIDTHTEILGQDSINGKFVVKQVKVKTSYADLIKQIISMPNGDGGIGDLIMQMAKMEIADKCDKGGKEIELTDAEVQMVKKAYANWKCAILHKDLIAFQKKLTEM